jgi:hypothetical protein
MMADSTRITFSHAFSLMSIPNKRWHADDHLLPVRLDPAEFVFELPDDRFDRRLSTESTDNS